MPILMIDLLFLIVSSMKICRGWFIDIFHSTRDMGIFPFLILLCVMTMVCMMIFMEAVFFFFSFCIFSSDIFPFVAISTKKGLANENGNIPGGEERVFCRESLIFSLFFLEGRKEKGKKGEMKGCIYFQEGCFYFVFVLLKKI